MNRAKVLGIHGMHISGEEMCVYVVDTTSTRAVQEAKGQMCVLYLYCDCVVFYKD